MRKVLSDKEEDALGSHLPTGIATQIEPVESATATLEPLSTEGFDLSVILLATLLILALVLILWRWQFRKAPRRASKRASSNASRAKKPQPVEWNLDLEPPILLPATLSEPSGGVPYLESLDCPTGTVYFALNQPVSRVGRGEENELRIDNSFMGWQTVSRHHARIERDGEEVILIDENSSHGTKVDGRHSNSNLLQNDCIISFGLVKFAFRNPNLKSVRSFPVGKI